jgi:hypothetical protein
MQAVLVRTVVGTIDLTRRLEDNSVNLAQWYVVIAVVMGLRSAGRTVVPELTETWWLGRQ